MLCEEGDYYRLCSWSEKKPLDAWIVVSRDRREALLTCVQVLGVPNWRSERLILKGLDSDRNYRITVESGDPDSLSVSACFGEELMNAGLLIPSMQDFCSLLIYLKEAEER
jgi:alpha-galactosidase